MRAILFYFLQVLMASGILYGYYHFFLRNKAFHQYNRFYLLASVFISLLIPFLQIPVYFNGSDSQSAVVLQRLQQMSMGGFEQGDGVPINTTTEHTGLNWTSIMFAIYISVALLFFMRIALSIVKIRNLRRHNPTEKLGDIEFVSTEEPGTPFSFFRWLFWDRKITLHSPEGEQIFRHEVYHIRQRHSLDVIFLEILTMLCWINPFFHLAKRELRAIHEFLADQFAIRNEAKWEYAQLLLMQALNTKQTLVTPFFHNQIKRRIAMITNPQKTSHRYLRKLLVLPVAALLLTVFAFRFKQQLNEKPVSHFEDQVTIVLDAGHGGIDPGALSPDSKYTEAALSLQIARKVQSLAAEYNVRVVMTRESDVLPGGATNKDDGLRNRVHIAETTQPDAFIALHVNVSEPGKFQTQYSGFEAYIAGKKVDLKGRLLASALLQEMAPVYSTEMTVQQRKESGIYVLDANKFPSVILQCGYINNRKDLAFISDPANQEKIARTILKAVRNYKVSKETSAIMEVPVRDTTPPVKTVMGVRVDRDSSMSPIMVKGQPMGEPMIVINGVVSKQSTKKVLDSLKPENIKEVSILKDQSAIAKYGEKATGGVIEITTLAPGETAMVSQRPEINEVVVVGYGPAEKSAREPIFEKVEIEPSFIGGKEAWDKFLQRNLNANVAVQNNAPAGHYTVQVKFVVDKEGNISNFIALTQNGYGMEEEVVRVLRSGNLWSPGVQAGKKVKSWRIQQVTFVVERGKS